MSPAAMVLWISPALVPGEAELLLRAVDARIAAAKSLRIEFVIDSRTFGRFTRGSVLLADGNRFRQEMKTLWLPPTLVIGDGKGVFARPAAGAADAAFPSDSEPDWHNAVLQSWLGRGGTFLARAAVSERIGKHAAGRPGPSDGPRTSNAMLLPDETVNGAPARVVEYDLVWPLLPKEFAGGKVRVWIDAKTKLPLRRTLVLAQPMVLEGKPVEDVLTATHTKFEIDPKLDAGLFELPK
jgi:outer membrane lipoprotein-sorting protein